MGLHNVIMIATLFRRQICSPCEPTLVLQLTPYLLPFFPGSEEQARGKEGGKEAWLSDSFESFKAAEKGGDGMG